MLDGFENYTSDGGLKKKIIERGEERLISPVKGQKVKVKYCVKILLDKAEQTIDQSKDNSTFEFNVGLGQVIKGWDLGVLGMKKHEKSW